MQAAKNDAAAAADLYRAAKNPDLGPGLRESKLVEAIRLWEGCAESPVIHANLGKAHMLLGSLSITTEYGQQEPVLNAKMRMHHYARATQRFTAACASGAELLDSCRDSFEALLALHADELPLLQGATCNSPHRELARLNWVRQAV